ncbi:MAG: metallophosphoesterase family protein [Phycisphaerae bacterium]|nr:metallophosphoesterase family protein [Phycisphaerae bacterium]
MPTVVGLLSDSHSRWERTKRALEALQARGATVFVHCGDVEDDLVLDQLAGLDCHLVWGNCDWNRGRLDAYARNLGITVHGDAGQVEVDGKSIAFTHGHEPDLMRAPVAAGAHYLVHGHTHELRDETRAGTRIINPGALHRAPRFTVALLTPAIDELETLVIPT